VPPVLSIVMECTPSLPIVQVDELLIALFHMAPIETSVSKVIVVPTLLDLRATSPADALVGAPFTQVAVLHILVVGPVVPVELCVTGAAWAEKLGNKPKEIDKATR